MVVILLSSPCLGSYRVYVLKITHPAPRGKAVKVERVRTTLDPEQYASYHGLYGRSSVELVDTWYCPGDTSRRAYCKKPADRPTRGLASTEEKRVTLPYNYQPVIP